MALVNYTALYDLVLPDLPNVPQPLALHHIQLAAAEFFERSKLWYYEHPLIDVVAGTHTYAFVPPDAKSEVCGIQQAWYGGTKMYPRSPLSLNEMYMDWLTQTGTPYYYARVSRLSIRIVPIPIVDLADGLKVWVNLKPTKTATGIDAEYVDEWREVIAAGAKARIALIPKKPYTEPNMAPVWAQQFEDGYNLARQQANNGMVEDGDITITLE